MKIIFLGPPGCGKGTHAHLLAKKFSFFVISTGDIVRSEINSGSEFGKLLKKYVETGELVPDDIIIKLVERNIKDKNSFILDGFPRTLNQAKLLENITKIEKVVYFSCSVEEILSRLTSRRVCPKCNRIYNLKSNPPKNKNFCDYCNEPLIQRVDDTKEVILNRIKVYNNLTTPLLNFYKSMISINFIKIYVDNLSIEEVHKILLKKLFNYKEL